MGDVLHTEIVTTQQWRLTVTTFPAVRKVLEPALTFHAQP